MNEKIYKHSIHNRPDVLRSELCGCFCCLHIFTPAAIDEWCDNQSTAICPNCGIDAVLGDASPTPKIDKELLKAMRDYFFKPADSQ